MISLENENIILWVNSNEERIEVSNLNIDLNKFYLELIEREELKIRIPILDYTLVKEGDTFSIQIETEEKEEEKLFKILHAITGTPD